MEFVVAPGCPQVSREVTERVSIVPVRQFGVVVQFGQAVGESAERA